MPHFQPRPMVVIRNQLLAFLVLHILGSCVPIQSVQSGKATVAECCNSRMHATLEQPRHIHRMTLQSQSR